jgi:GT2 family glycosyltransferase
MNHEPDPFGERYSMALEIRRIASELLVERRANRTSRARLVAVDAIYTEMRLMLRGMQASKFWRLRQAWFSLKHRLGLSPVGAADLFEPPAIDEILPDDRYENWQRDVEARPADLVLMRETAPFFPLRPKISILVPVYNAPEPYLAAMIDSVLAQTYDHWELCIADDRSTSPHVKKVLDEYAASDARIRLIYRTENGHISAASNSALEIATGEFVALLDHDDLLAPDALFHNVLALNREPDLDMLYSDEDKIDEDGRRRDVFFKPEWSPDRFLAQMYTSHFSVYRTSLVRAVGGFRAGFEGSQDYDLVLRLTERTNRIHHIPRVLYHWRIHAGSTASSMDTKTYAEVAAVRAIREALERRDEPGTVEPIASLPGSYVIRYAIKKAERVSIIIPTRDHADDVNRCLTSLFEKTEYPDFEVILVDNGSKDIRALETFRKFERLEPHRFRTARMDIPFNFSRLNNRAVREAASGQYLLFLNNDTAIIHADWLTAMVEQAQRPAIGAVGAKLLYQDGRIQHGGVVLGIGGIAGHAFRFFDRAHPGYYNALQITANYSAVTAACLMTRRDVFEQVGGFDEELVVAYNDVDICIKIRDAGYRLVYLPHVELYHYESLSRGFDTTPEQIARDKRERSMMEKRWAFSAIRDPYYNPNLTLKREDFTLAP